MNEKLIIYAASAVVIFFGLYCECTLSTIFYIGAIRLCIFMLKVTNSIIRNFFQASLNLEQRYGSGSWVLVTGAANGIGLEYCKQFARRNFNLIMIDKDEQGLENAKEIIKHYHSNIKINAISCDLSSLKSVESNNNFLKSLMDLDISILVNNAGIGDAIPFNELSRDKIQSIIQINMIIPVIFTSFLYNTLSQRSHSGVINMASVAGILPNPSSMIYSMTKGFLRYHNLKLCKTSFLILFLK